MTQVLRLKVGSSLSLDRIFHDEPLDFFISSPLAASVAGHPGQADHTSPNLFISRLAQQGRRRALFISVLDLGLILGTCYITREKSNALIKPSIDRGFLTISESGVYRLR